MELPHLGTHCSKSFCNKLDFLPIKCDACGEIFCNEHYHYSLHDCPNAYKVSNQVPVCPLCNIPIPVARGQQPDAAVGEHMDNDCQSDPAKSRRKVFNNKCSRKACKTKEFIPLICNGCSQNFCLKHRHPEDHNCQGKDTSAQNGITKMISTKNKYTQVHQNQNTLTELYHGSMTEDEALARALATSMQETSKRTNKTQEELDHALAMQLQASESQSTTAATRNTRDRCNVS